jgi:hypothetical protein
MGVLRYLFISAEYSKFLEGIKHPITNAVLNEQGLQRGITSQVFTSFKMTTQGESSKAGRLSLKLLHLSKSEKIIHEVEEEFEEMVHWFIDIEGRTMKEFGNGSEIKFNEIIESLIGLVDVEGITLPKDLQIMGLKIIRKVIEVENKDFTTPAAEWDTDDWSKYEQQIEA